MALPLVTAVTLHGTPAQVGMVAASAMLPYLLFSLLAGHVLEGRDRRRIMRVANLVQASAVGSVPAAWALGWLSVWWLVVAAFVSGCGALAFGVVGFSYVPDLVPADDLAAANRAIQGSRTVAEVAGPGLAGALVGALGAPLAMAADAISYLASALGISRSRPLDALPAEPSAPSGPRPGIWDGMRLLFTNQYLRALTIHAAAFNLAEQVFILNLVLWAVQHQHLSPAHYGLAIGTAGIGGLLGTLTALRLSKTVGLGRAFVASLVLSCGAPLLAVIWDVHGAGLAGILAGVMFLSGVGLGNANVYSLTLRQSVIPRDQLTRSAGAYTQLMYGAIPIGSALAGLGGQSLGVHTAALAGAVGMAASILPMLTGPILALSEPTQSV